MKKPLFKVGTETALFVGKDKTPCIGIVESIDRRKFMVIVTRWYLTVTDLLLLKAI